MTQPKGPMVDVGDLFFQFKEIGDNIAGAYLGSQPIRWSDGSIGQQHYIDTGEGVYNFNGTYQLNGRLAMVQPGGHVEIEFINTAPTARGLSPVKLFRIQTDSPVALPAPQGQPPLPLDVSPAPQYPQGPPQYPQGQSQYQQPVMGGMPAHQAMPNYPPGSPGNAAALQQANQQPYSTDTQGQPVLQYLPDGTPVFGFTPDGTQLDAYGKIITQGMGS